jgi:hypothetical protein
VLFLPDHISIVSMSEGKRVILCGKSHQVGNVVIELLKPEYKGSICGHIPTQLTF